MLSKLSWGLAVAGAELCFIGYCIYFDHKRRSDPKAKLRERRRLAKQQKSSKGISTKLPELTNPEAMQKFFLSEVQKGEELLATGTENYNFY